MRLAVSPHIFPTFEILLHLSYIFQVNFPLLLSFFDVAGKLRNTDQINRISAIGFNRGTNGEMIMQTSAVIDRNL